MGSLEPQCRHQQQPQLVDRPIFHVASRSGWVNDPNAPLYWKGRYHLFYQYVGHSTRWTWGLCWGHASSTDLIHWQHHEPALKPTHNTPDQDGCFSGCAAIIRTGSRLTTAQSNASLAAVLAQSGLKYVDSDGVVTQDVPILLYTGVVKRPEAPEGLRPTSFAVSELCIEKQMAAVPADPDDPYLTQWIKIPEPWLARPPQELCLNCFRDPFVLESPSAANSNTWRVMIGSGIRDPNTGLVCAGETTCSSGAHQGQQPAGFDLDPRSELRRAGVGTALVYKSEDVLSGWEYEGNLCVALNRDTDGAVWECPMMVPLPLLGGQDTPEGSVAPTPSDPMHTHLFSLSLGKSPAVYWLGRYRDGKFDLVAADGPHPIDLGDLLYAPNVLTNSPDGAILWGWLSELPNPGGTHDYAGCISLPRWLHITPDGHLHQQPALQLRKLHTEPSFKEQSLQLDPGQITHIGSQVPTSYFDLELTLVPPPPTAATAGTDSRQPCVAGLILPSWTATSSSSSGSSTAGSSSSQKQIIGQGAVLLYNFSNSRLTLLVGDGIAAPQSDTDEPGAAATRSSNAPSLNSYIEAAEAAAAAGTANPDTRVSSGLTNNVRVLHGQLHIPANQRVKIRVLMDYSLLEVFTGDGQVLSTRVCRGVWPAVQDSSNSSGFSSQGLGAPATHSSKPPAVASEPASAGATAVAVSAGRSKADEAGSGDSSVEDGRVAGGSVPCGCHLIAYGGSVLVQDISMSAMRSAWVH